VQPVSATPPSAPSEQNLPLFLLHNCAPSHARRKFERMYEFDRRFVTRQNNILPEVLGRLWQDPQRGLSIRKFETSASWELELTGK
jgi:hypothetical protein